VPSTARSRVRGELRAGGAEEPEGPLLRELAGAAEHDGHVRVADLQLRDEVGEEPRLHVLAGEQVGVAALDDHRCTVEGRELGHHERQRRVDRTAREVVEGLALHRGDDPAVHRDAVVPRRQLLGVDHRLLVREPVAVPLPGVLEDREHLRTRRPAGRYPQAGAHAPDGAGGLPEDALAAALEPREHELRAVLPVTVEDEVDRPPPPGAVADRHLLDELELLALGPRVSAVAVDLAGARPGLAGLEQQRPVGDRYPQQVAELRARIRVARDAEGDGHHDSLATGPRPCKQGRADRHRRTPDHWAVT
jgi:hypothetical protein